MLSADVWRARQGVFLPSADDGAFVQSLMRPERVPGAFAGWIAPPKTGVDGKPGDFEYVRLRDS